MRPPPIGHRSIVVILPICNPRTRTICLHTNRTRSCADASTASPSELTFPSPVSLLWLKERFVNIFKTFSYSRALINFFYGYLFCKRHLPRNKLRFEVPGTFSCTDFMNCASCGFMLFFSHTSRQYPRRSLCFAHTQPACGALAVSFAIDFCSSIISTFLPPCW